MANSKHQVRFPGESESYRTARDKLLDANERGWRNLRFLSSAGSTYNHDYQGENAKGEQMPALNVFVRKNGRISHFYNTELMFAPSDPGQDMRRVDMIWPLWNLFDVIPEGRGEKWGPKLSY